MVGSGRLHMPEHELARGVQAYSMWDAYARPIVVILWFTLSVWVLEPVGLRRC